MDLKINSGMVEAVVVELDHLRQRLGELADEWEKRDSITIEVCKRSGSDAASCGLAACDNGCDLDYIECIPVRRAVSELRSTLSQEGSDG